MYPRHKNKRTQRRTQGIGSTGGRMKIIICIIMIVSFAITATADYDGRFQVLTEDRLVNGSIKPVTVKIDTDTGDSWMLIGTTWKSFKETPDKDKDEDEEIDVHEEKYRKIFANKSAVYGSAGRDLGESRW